VDWQDAQQRRAFQKRLIAAIKQALRESDPSFVEDEEQLRKITDFVFDEKLVIECPLEEESWVIGYFHKSSYEPLHYVGTSEGPALFTFQLQIIRRRGGVCVLF